MSVGAVRMAVAGFGFLAIVGLRFILKRVFGSGKALGSDPTQARTGGGHFLPGRADFWALAAGLIGVSLYQILFFSGVRLTGVAIGTVVTIGTAPVFTALVASLFLKEFPERRWYPSALVIVVGMAFLFGAGGGSFNVAGMLLNLGAGLAYAVYALGCRELAKRHPVDIVSLWTFLGAALLLSPAYVFFGAPSWLLEPRGLLVALHLGIINAVVAYLFFFSGIKLVNPTTGITLTLLEPLIATVLGIALFGERPSSLGIIGMVFMGIGLLWLGIPARKKDSVRI